MPVIDLETPTLCLVGALNVGKSSLVLVLSTRKPEVDIRATLIYIELPEFSVSCDSETGSEMISRGLSAPLFLQDLRQKLVQMQKA
nr:nucleolar GTP-binding protein 1 [Ipomoea batatas]